MKKTICIILSVILTLGALTLPTFAEAEYFGQEYGEKYGEDGFNISYYKLDNEEFVWVEKYYMDRWKDIDGVHRTHPRDRFKVIFSEGRKTACLAKYEGSGDSIVFPDTVTGVPVTSMDVDCFADYSGYINEIHLGKYFSDFNYLSIPRLPELAKITVSPENEKYYDIDGILMQRNECTDENYNSFCGDTMLFCPHNATGTFYIPDEAGIIATGAFMDINVDEIVFSECTFRVCDDAFQNCTFDRLVVKNPYMTATSNYTHDSFANNIIYEYDNAMRQNNNSPLSQAYSKRIATTARSFGLHEIDSMQFFMTEDTDGSIVMKLWKYTGGVSELTIPDTVYDFPVTGIMYKAFASNKTLTKVTVPDTVKVIMPRAFSGAEKLSEVVLGDGVEDVGYLAFSDCGKLTKVTVGKNVKKINADTFRNCTNMETVELSSENPHLYSTDSVIYNGDKTEALYCIPFAVGIIRLPQSVKKIYARTFCGCKYIKEIVLNEGLETIGAKAFAGCSRLTALILPSTVRIIGSGAFSDMTFTEFSVPEGVEAICEKTFSGCSNMKTVYLPRSITEIGENAFSGCDSLTDVYYGANGQKFRSMAIGDGNDALYEDVSWHFDVKVLRKGDVNRDEKVNVSDSLVLRCLICGKEEPDEAQFTAGDINADKKLNAMDSRMLSSLITGK